ncbi:ACT domain-containing protein [Tanacetum coccineum]
MAGPQRRWPLWRWGRGCGPMAVGLWRAVPGDPKVASALWTGDRWVAVWAVVASVVSMRWPLRVGPLWRWGLMRGGCERLRLATRKGRGCVTGPTNVGGLFGGGKAGPWLMGVWPRWPWGPVPLFYNCGGLGGVCAGPTRGGGWRLVGRPVRWRWQGRGCPTALVAIGGVGSVAVDDFVQDGVIWHGSVLVRFGIIQNQDAGSGLWECNKVYVIDKGPDYTKGSVRLKVLVDDYGSGLFDTDGASVYMKCSVQLHLVQHTKSSLCPTKQTLYDEELTDVGLGYIGKYGHNLRYLFLNCKGVSGLVELSKGCPKLYLWDCPFSKQVVATFVFNIHSLRYVWVENGYRTVLALTRSTFTAEVTLLEA